MLFPPTFVRSLFGSRHWLQVQRGIFNKHIMKEQGCNAAAQESHHRTRGSAVAHLCSNAYCLLLFPNGHFSSRSIHKRLTRQKWAEWHSLSGGPQINGCPLSSLPFRETREPQTEKKADYHSINKTGHNVKQEQKQKAASVFSPRKRLCQQPLYVTQSKHRDSHVRARRLVMALLHRKVHSSHLKGGRRRRWGGNNRRKETYSSTRGDMFPVSNNNNNNKGNIC